MNDLPPQKLIILDLDETLIHASTERFAHQPDFVFDEYHVYKRPGLENFLLSLIPHYRLAIWSSAGEEYVQQIIAQLKPAEVIFEFVWSRNKCSLRRDYDTDSYFHEKRLSKVKKKGFELESILLVDDSPEKARSNFGNAVYVTEFTGDLSDTELTFLSEYLISLKDVPNVRIIEKRGWRERGASSLKV